MRTGFFVTVCLMAIFAHGPFGYCENYQYESHGKRDPFVPLVGSERPAIGRLEDVSSYTDVRLEGIATGAGGRIVAILNGQVVKEGDTYGEVKIQKIAGTSVTILFNNRPYEINLNEEEGGGPKSGR